MSTDFDEMDEFNDRVEAGESNRPKAIGRISDDSQEVALSTSADIETSQLRAKMWAVQGDAYIGCEQAIDTLPAGQYTIKHHHNIGVHFSKHTINLDDLLILPDSASEEIINGIEDFWNKEQHFRKFGFLWKRGVLLWGPAGSGKTSTLQLISKKIIDRNGLAIYINNPELGHAGLELLRRIEPNRPIVVMLEDIDALIEAWGEADLLALLDGELQIDNVVFIATTNYPERLDKRLVNRPSRFDVVKKIGMPSKEARVVYLSNKNPRLANTDELAQWVDLSEGFSIAHLKELIVSVEVFEVDVDAAAHRLRKMMDDAPSSSDIGRRAGFFHD
jgi:AAA+ superfamily predicted ATPase